MIRFDFFFVRFTSGCVRLNPGMVQFESLSVGLIGSKFMVPVLVLCASLGPVFIQLEFVDVELLQQDCVTPMDMVQGQYI